VTVWWAAGVLAVLFVPVPPAALAQGADMAADPLGRLFTSAKERRALDELRNATSDEPVIDVERIERIAVTPADEPTEESRNPIRIRGVVTRSNGRGTTWINDGNTMIGDPVLEYVKIVPSDSKRGQISIQIPDREELLEIKVGQTYEPLADRIVDPASAPAVSR